MAIVIAGIWERGWMSPVVEKDMWMEMAKAYNVDMCIMTPRSHMDDIRADKLKECRNIEEALQEYPDLVRVFVTSPNEYEKLNIEVPTLYKFKHPENAFYIFGNNCSNSIYLRQKEDKIVTIERACAYPVWAVIACGIVLYDRYIKCQ